MFGQYHGDSKSLPPPYCTVTSRKNKIWRRSLRAFAAHTDIQFVARQIVIQSCQLHLPVVIAAACTCSTRVVCVPRNEITSANDEWHKVREEKLRANNLAQQRANLDSRVTELESECSSLQQQVQQDTAKREPLDAKKRQFFRSAPA